MIGAIPWQRFRLESPVGLFVLLCLLSAICSLVTPAFLEVQNVLNLVRSIAVLGTISLGMTLVLLAGEIDLSVGSVAALSVVVGALAMGGGESSGPVILTSIGAGALAGLVNGIGVTLFRVPSLIMTLGTLAIVRALASIISGGLSSYPTDLGVFMAMGRGVLFGIPVPIVIFVSLVLFVGACVKLSPLGRMLYLMGGNPRAAELSGVKSNSVKLAAFTISGVFAGIAGVIQSARVGVINPSMGQGFELIAIAMAVLGGASLYGGKGSVEGTFVAALIFGVMYNWLNLLGFSGHAQQIFVALVIVVIASLHAMKEHK